MNNDFTMIETRTKNNRLPRGYLVSGLYRYDDKPSVRTLILSNELMKAASLRFGDKVSVGFKVSDGKNIIKIQRSNEGRALAKIGGKTDDSGKASIKFSETVKNADKFPEVVFDEADVEVASGLIIATENDGFTYV